MVLTATFLTAACRRLLAAEAREGLPFGAYAALALGSQFLLRGHLLRHGDSAVDVLPEGADDFLAACRDAHGLPIEGLMCVPPHGLEPAPWFALLAKLAAEGKSFS